MPGIDDYLRDRKKDLEGFSRFVKGGSGSKPKTTSKPAGPIRRNPSPLEGGGHQSRSRHKGRLKAIKKARQSRTAGSYFGPNR